MAKLQSSSPKSTSVAINGAGVSRQVRCPAGYCRKPSLARPADTTLRSPLPIATLRYQTPEVIRFDRMELAIQVQIEELPEGLFLATSHELSGLVVQGRTVAEALEIARDVARKLLEARRERDDVPNLPSTTGQRDYTIVVAA